MIPIHLALQGIYSYQEKQSIDFTRLTEASIFGIFGTVGSGKSTILEAITYALYGKTDRLNLSGDNRNYNMMNLKSNELLIEFIFKTGKADTEYMATVKSRRNSKQFEDVKSLDRAAYKKVNNEWQPIEVESLETIIGLSYENFKRTIIIPQGKFQEFLQLGKTERTQMMKELFNLDKYELFYKVVSLETKNNQQLQNLEGQLKQLGELSQEQIAGTENAIEILKKEIEFKAQDLLLHQEQEGKIRKIKELTIRISELNQTISQLKAQEPAFILLDKNIKEYEYCRLNFESILESAKEISNKIKLFEQSISKDNSILNETRQQLAELEKLFETLKHDYEGREILNLQAEELDKIKKLHELDKAGKILNERITNGEKIYHETVERVFQLKQLQEGLTSSIKALKSQYPDMAVLSQVKDWYTVNKLLLSTNKDITLESDSIKNDLREIESQKSQLLENECFVNILPSEDSAVIATILEEKKLHIKHLIENLSIDLEHLAIQAKLGEYATNLAEGKPCPLCGALTHPQPLNAQNVSQAIENLRLQKSVYEKEINAIEQDQKRLSEIETKYHLKSELLQKVLLRQKEQAGKISEHQKAFAWDSYKEETYVLEEFTKADQLLLQIKQKEVELEKMNQQVEEGNQSKEKFNKAIEELRHHVTANIADVRTFTSQIKQFTIQEFENKTIEEIEMLKVSCLKRYREIESIYETTTNKIGILRKEADTITGRLDANRKVLLQESESQNKIALKIQDQLNQSAYASISDVEKVLSQHLDVEKEKKRVFDFNQSLDFSEKQQAGLISEIGEQQYNQEQHLELLTLISQITEEVNLKNQQQGKLESELKSLKINLETQLNLRSQFTSLQLRAEDIKTLKQLFKGSGFVNYISSVYLQELCHAANERFYKLTRQKLSLEVTGENNFQVRDFMNGGKVRNVKTLSGGQTFQAALSLALALADNIKKITESNQNFFFLDEGFGSLDKESLDIVFDTLKSLRKENRIVGVISHVEEMQQEIEAHLRIVNHEEQGSLIRASWEY